ncbi:hypothetical protein L1987_18062 [Smallanthus sonchifolius]|uniref:Uncharacterized protein n=1 Tax=Smallanthus sonchifolius TaxID=185202 RepID=A0ACB9J0S2_9ASTR|nr:hypothetical protein L1987_18062 [Smallanthus sonchifolius]
MVSDSDLADRLREFLSTSDLTTTTTASIRRKLEQEFGIDLTDKKAFIRQQIDLYLQNQQQNDEDHEDEEQEEVEEEVEEEEESSNGKSGGSRKRGLLNNFGVTFVNMISKIQPIEETYVVMDRFMSFLVLIRLTCFK